MCVFTVFISDSSSEVAVAWNTNDTVQDPVVEWGPEAYPTVRNNVPASSATFEEKSEQKRVQYVHMAVLRPLANGAKYGKF